MSLHAAFEVLGALAGCFAFACLVGAFIRTGRELPSARLRRDIDDWEDLPYEDRY